MTSAGRFCTVAKDKIIVDYKCKYLDKVQELPTSQVGFHGVDQLLKLSIFNFFKASFASMSLP